MLENKSRQLTWGVCQGLNRKITQTKCTKLYFSQNILQNPMLNTLAQHQQKGSIHKYFLLIRNKMQLVGVLTCRAYNNIDQVLHLWFQNCFGCSLQGSNGYTFVCKYSCTFVSILGQKYCFREDKFKYKSVESMENQC